MKIFYINFASSKFRNSQLYLNKKYTDYGFNCIAYNEIDVHNFILNNKKFSINDKGYAYWIWKPYLILKTINEIANNDDIVFYSDCGDNVVNNPYLLIYSIINDNNFFIIENIYKNIQYTKRDCFHLMNCDNELYHNSMQIEAGICGFKKNKYTIDLLNEWLFFCQNYDVISDNEYLPRYSNFIEHRHDQSILTNIIIKNNIKKIKIYNLNNYFKFNSLDN